MWLGEVGVKCPGTGDRIFPVKETAAKKIFQPFDVGPITRQLLPSADDFFDGTDDLTLFNALVWRQVAKRAVRPTLIVVHTPGVNDVLSLSERGELVHVHTLVSQSPVKRYKKGFPG